MKVSRSQARLYIQVYFLLHYKAVFACTTVLLKRCLDFQFSIL
jgi:hypothetical protein